MNEETELFTPLPAPEVSPEALPSNEASRDFGLLGRIPAGVYIAGLGVGVPMTIAEGWFGAAVGGGIALAMGIMSRGTDAQ